MGAVFKYGAHHDRAFVVNETASDNGTPKHPFDLEERTAKFGEAIVRFSKKSHATRQTTG